MSCIGCSQAITRQKANDEEIIALAKQIAKQQQRSVGLYRNEEGVLSIAPQAEGYPIIMFVTEEMQ